MTKQKAIAKIQALRRLALQAGTSEEASLAAAKAWDLKKKYGLDEDDIRPRPVPIRPTMGPKRAKTRVVAKQREIRPADLVVGAADEFVRKQHPVVQGVYAQYRAAIRRTVEDLFIPPQLRRSRAR